MGGGLAKNTIKKHNNRKLASFIKRKSIPFHKISQFSVSKSTEEISHFDEIPGSKSWRRIKTQKECKKMQKFPLGAKRHRLEKLPKNYKIRRARGEAISCNTSINHWKIDGRAFALKLKGRVLGHQCTIPGGAIQVDIFIGKKNSWSLSLRSLGLWFEKLQWLK